MVRSENLWLDKSFFDAIFKNTWYEEIIDTPSDISFSGTSKIAPPTILARDIRVKMSESIDPSSSKKSLKPCPFLDGKSMFSNIGSRIRKVYFLVCDIEITTEYYWLFCFKWLHIGEEGGIPYSSVGKSREIVFWVWSIDGHEVVCLVFSTDNSSFSIMLRKSHPVRHG